MSDVTPTGESIEHDRIDRTAQQFVDVSNMIERFPDETPITKSTMHTLSVYVDENGDLKVPAPVFTLELLKAVVRLEARVMYLEGMLKKSGALGDDFVFPPPGVEF